MSDASTGDTGPIQFSEHLAGSSAFTALFREGMDLVEETAAYLDGEAGPRRNRWSVRSA